MGSTTVSPVSVDSDVCRDLGGGLREWLETNGRGSYGMGPLSNCATRRYHGFLTVARRPPLGRFQLINRLEEKVIRGGSHVALSCQAYPGAAPLAGGSAVGIFSP